MRNYVQEETKGIEDLLEYDIGGAFSQKISARDSKLAMELPVSGLTVTSKVKTY